MADPKTDPDDPETDPAPPPDPSETTWDPQGDQLAAVSPVTVTSDDPAARGAQNTV